MSVLFTLLSIPLTHALALKLVDGLENFAGNEPDATTMDEVDETNGFWQVTAYYRHPPEAEELAPLRQSLSLPDDSLKLEQLPDTDWVAKSLEGLQSVTAGRFYIHGSHDEVPRSGGISLQIDAGTAFGTGHHGTTRGCLMVLDRILNLRHPRNVLDIGCGTGVLAIAAAAAARCPALATDIDPEATRVTAANAAANLSAPLVSTITATGTHDRRIAARAPYGVVFANILAKPLIALAGSIVPLTERGGHIVLSGLTTDQERWVLPAYRNRGAILKQRLRLAGWSTLWLVRP